MVHEVIRRVRSNDRILSTSAGAAYAAFLGYYKGQMKRMGMARSESLVSVANEFASSAGFVEPPMLKKGTVSKMGLKGVAGLNIGSSGDFADTWGGGGGRGRRGSGGGRGRGGGGRGGLGQGRGQGRGRGGN